MVESNRILIIDDSPEDLSILGELLSAYKRNFAIAGEVALNQLEASSELPDLILLDVMMRGMDGFEVCRRLKSNERTSEIPVIFITSVHDPASETIGLEMGAIDYISKPYNAAVVKARVKTHLALQQARATLSHQNTILEEQVTARTEQLRHALEQVHKSSLETIFRLARAAEFKDECTGEHVIRMSRYSAIVARKMGFSTEDAEALLSAAPMHDIGKIGIPDNVLLKPGKLDAAEWECMRGHTLIGARILSGSASATIKLAEIIALTHHEKWDGSGYPHNLAGAQIPIHGRIAAIADVFDALTSQRPYKNAFTTDAAFGIILLDRGKHFDPRVTDAFLECKTEILDVKNAFLDAKLSPQSTPQLAEAQL